jgi:hypothetical protein
VTHRWADRAGDRISMHRTEGAMDAPITAAAFVIAILGISD